MLREFLEKLTTIVDQRRPDVLHIPGDPPHVHHIRHLDGRIERVETTPGSRTINVDTLDDLINLAVQPFDRRMTEAEKRAIFISTKSVVLVFNTERGTERAELLLSPSDEYKFFEERLDAPCVCPSKLRDALRTILCDTGFDSKLIEQVSKVDFSTLAGKKVDVDRGKESMGHSINREVMAPVGMPDELQTFNVRMFNNPDLNHRFPIRCVLDPDLTTYQWSLKPQKTIFTDFVDKNMTLIRKRIVDSVSDANVAVYRGTFQQDLAGQRTQG